MEFWMWLATALLILLGYIFYITYYKYEMELNKMFPFPSNIPVFGLLYQLFINRADIYGMFREISWYFRRSYCISIFGTRYIVIFEAADLEKILGVPKHLEKADAYKHLHNWLGSGLLTSSGGRWKKSRKILTPAFHFNILETFVEIFYRNGKILEDKLMSKIGKPNFDVYKYIKLYALDNISECAMGVKVNAQTNPNGEYVNAINTLCETTFNRIVRPWVWPNFLFALSTEGKRNKKALTVVHNLTRSVIESRRKEIQSTRTEAEKIEGEDITLSTRKKMLFIDILITSNEAGGLTSEEIREEIDTFMFEQKAYEEQVALFGDDDRVPTLSDLNNMKMLEMIIKESLRHYPSVPAIARLIEEDVIFDQKSYAPKGSYALIITNIFHYNIYRWEKPMEFYPEHFELEAVARRHPYQYIPFSAGPRNCIGMRFAMYEMKAALGAILRKVEILPADPPVPLVPVVALVNKSKTGMHIRVRDRKKI